MMPGIVKSESCRPLGSRGRLLVAPLAASLAIAFLDCCAPALSAHARATEGWSGAFGPSVGIASYYGKEFNGRKTASGERFNMHTFTAAHRTP